MCFTNMFKIKTIFWGSPLGDRAGRFVFLQKVKQGLDPTLLKF